jgi:hypothetical protein
MKPKQPWIGYVKHIVAEYPRLKGVDTPGAKRKRDAVEFAIAAVSGKPNAALRMKLLEIVFWRKTHTIGGAAMQIPCHVNTARIWQSDFLRLVAEYLNLP